MDQKEKWIEEHLNTETFIGKAPVSEDMMMRLKAIPSIAKTTYDSVPKKVVWAVAASIAILICVNIFSLNGYESSSNEGTAQTEYSDSYFSYLKQL